LNKKIYIIVNASIASRFIRSALPGSFSKTTLLLTSQPISWFPFISPPPIKNEKPELHFKNPRKSWMGIAKMNEIAIPSKVIRNNSRKWHNMEFIEHIIVFNAKLVVKNQK
jgi:hypothetical protein